ncbi:GNAT family N-acetyltransferase [Candidatus Entotheonella palauensis]|uniref:N-acetyltransferase domain-containing protein n=1 Tax=Candidatus Entotheonella gemina TaxID=1429439 RepID=W4MB05_9BACT|nr:GNAT family protein [Candidatus Entotheonella palauensis]ETX07559.1 MAG: hypothetical protein ETSY2_10485 [Candidatus Entotheonella gemina]
MRHVTTFTLDDCPPHADLMALWEAIAADDTVPGNFMDTFPSTLTEFLDPIQDGSMHLWLIRVDGVPVGAHWYHDRGLWGNADSVWTAGYRLPSARGKLGHAPQVEANLIATEQLGVKHFFAACRVNNVRSQRFVEKCGYHPAGIYPKWGWFDGDLDDVVLYTLMPEDQELLMYQARQRAVYQQGHALLLA